MAISLVVADDHPIILDGLELLFRSEQDFQVLARCVNGGETLQAVRQHRPDVLILDIRMPGMDGFTVVRRLQEEKQRTRVVVLTVSLDEDELMTLVRLGVRGVVLKEMAPQMLVHCVRKVHAGEQWLEKRSFGRALEKILRREAGMREVADALTPREIEIMRMVAAGLRNKEIGDRLSISEGTVKIHLHHIYEKLRLDGRLELALYAQAKGLL